MCCSEMVVKLWYSAVVMLWWCGGVVVVAGRGGEGVAGITTQPSASVPRSRLSRRLYRRAGSF